MMPHQLTLMIYHNKLPELAARPNTNLTSCNRPALSDSLAGLRGAFKFNIGTDVMSKYVTGTVKWFSAEKGFGFIVNADQTDVFVHHRDIQAEGFRTLNEGQRVEYMEVKGDKGLAAKEVQVIG